MTEKSHKVEVVVKGLNGAPDQLRDIAVELEAKATPAAPSQPVTLTDEATKNAARYVWLRDVHIGNNPEYINLNPVKNGGLDAAIDALREKEQAK